MRLKIGLLALWIGICVPQGFAAGTVSRFVLVAGANFGGTDRLPLRYAVSDAEHFARVMEMMGGVEDVDRRVLREPSLEGFRDALRDLQAQVAETSGPGRTEVILYYSGHADEQGLLLGNEFSE